LGMERVGGEKGEYKSGWMGLRSVPRTTAEGYFWAVETLMDAGEPDQARNKV
jgi:hypothetical protein